MTCSPPVQRAKRQDSAFVMEQNEASWIKSFRDSKDPDFASHEHLIEVFFALGGNQENWAVSALTRLLVELARDRQRSRPRSEHLGKVVREGCLGPRRPCPARAHREGTGPRSTPSERACRICWRPVLTALADAVPYFSAWIPEAQVVGHGSGRGPSLARHARASRRRPRKPHAAAVGFLHGIAIENDEGGNVQEMARSTAPLRNMPSWRDKDACSH